MLTALSVQQFTLVDSLEIEFATGMTAITGETGAGKSLIVDALGMALGDRGDADRIRVGSDKSEIGACFDLTDNAPAQQWLIAHDYEPGNECLLRRIFTREGRSRGYINGQAATMQQLQELGGMLVDIHSQHEHQSLLRRETHRRLLDDFAVNGPLLEAVAQAYQQWRTAARRYETLQNNAEALNARRELLGFQVQELDQLGLAPGELEQLEEQQRVLANVDVVLEHGRDIIGLCAGTDGGDAPSDLLTQLGRAEHLMDAITHATGALHEARELLASADIQIQEAVSSLQRYLDNVDLDPARLQQVEDRLSAVYELARKHRIRPEQLCETHAQLADELRALADEDNDVEKLRANVANLESAYRRCARKLSAARGKAAQKFVLAINQQLAAMAMASATVEMPLQPLANDAFGAEGMETVELLIATNPGQPHRPLAKIASGGELSRVSLAIQVVAAQRSTIPVLVFDEVDVGVGGATGHVIGRLLRQLGEQGQVLCITHLPQVASCAHHHFTASKTQSSDNAASSLRVLDEAARVAEIARMLGSATASRQSLGHAREMLALGMAT